MYISYLGREWARTGRAPDYSQAIPAYPRAGTLPEYPRVGWVLLESSYPYPKSRVGLVLLSVLWPNYPEVLGIYPVPAGRFGTTLVPVRTQIPGKFCTTLGTLPKIPGRLGTTLVPVPNIAGGFGIILLSVSRSRVGWVLLSVPYPNYPTQHDL